MLVNSFVVCVCVGGGGGWGGGGGGGGGGNSLIPRLLPSFCHILYQQKAAEELGMRLRGHILC